MINIRKAKKYCADDISLIENYNEAYSSPETWDCHHRLEIQGPFRNSKELLIRCGVYYGVPASQLIFLSRKAHMRLHNVGVKFSDDTRKRMSDSHKGKPKSEEQKRKLSEAAKRRIVDAEINKKICSAGGKATLGMKWFSNGVKTIKAFSCPDGFHPGRK